MSKKTEKDYEKIGRMMEDIVTTGSSNWHRMIWYNFVKGLAYGLGIFLAGTLVIGVVIAILNQFETAPLIGPLVQHITDNLQK
jgi:hypothetical protein